MAPDESDQFLVLDEMVASHLSGPDIYHASKFWEQLNRLNIDWLKSDGLNNFKRTVNNNYFNWMVTLRAATFRKVARSFLRRAVHSPGKLWEAAGINIKDMVRRTMVSENTQTTLLERKIYALYLLFLYDFVERHDRLGLLDKLEEPEIGSPLCIDYRGKRVSQDIANSYLEYLYIRTSLTEEKFSSIRTIGEIGGGYGRLSYVFHLLHKNDGLKLVLIDLPPALFVAQWYLTKVFPDAKVMKWRNFTDFSEIQKEFKESSICFLLPHQLELIPQGSLDLLINISSLQEMTRAQINRYYELIDEKARFFYTKQWVLWDNPEDKMTVPAVIYPTRPAWELVSARQNPVHVDFFEALFQLK